MTAESLSLRTDLIFWRHHGEVTDRGDYLVVQTPRNPNWHWGHVLVFKNAPTGEVLGTWKVVFDREFQEAARGIRVFTWDTGTLREEDRATFEGSGLREYDVMVLGDLREPRTVTADVRLVESDDEWKQLANISASAFRHETETDREFVKIRYQHYRELAEAGAGKFFGAWADGQIVGSLGIFHEGDLFRFQEVAVLEQYRHRGLASALIVRASKYAWSLSDYPTIVICARAGSDASRLYTGLGFVSSEKGYSLSVKSSA